MGPPPSQDTRQQTPQNMAGPHRYYECINFHKLTVYSIDAAERQRFYMLCNLRKPIKSSIRSHVTRMETLNKYLGLLPTIKQEASINYKQIQFYFYLLNL